VPLRAPQEADPVAKDTAAAGAGRAAVELAIARAVKVVASAEKAVDGAAATEHLHRRQVVLVNNNRSAFRDGVPCAWRLT
jgi:hypothetical protein